MPLRANAMAKKVTKVIYFYCSDIHFIQFEAARPEHAGHLNATNDDEKKRELDPSRKKAFAFRGHGNETSSKRAECSK